MIRYLPMLRTKAGEVIALEKLVASAKDRIFPVFHLVHKPPASFSKSLADAWANRALALDGIFLFNITGSTAAYSKMFDEIGKGNVQVMPSIEYDTNSAYLAAVQKLKDKYASGILVKAKLNELGKIESWVKSQGWTPNDIDLVVTLNEIGGYDPALLEPLVTKAITDNVASPLIWRSLTLSSSAAPKDMSNLKVGRNNVPRLDWAIWDSVSKKLPYELEYSDYSCVSPDLADPPGYVMASATVSVRYAIDDYWIVIKGKPTSGKSGQAMKLQYRAHAKALVADPQFDKVTGCWGDEKIQIVATTPATAGAGGRPQWASYTNSRHLSLVADRLP